ncbi:WbqC family protein [Rhodophyticola porphyridii]|uniref:WbqC family protein n=1 Tax=Rhodophyticola porphyridii TaxID=1852017 RepID=UPI0035D102AB
MTVVAISQPMYFPWAGFMEMMKLADVFLWLDDAQFSKGSFTNRIQVRTRSGTKWMTIPLEGKGTSQQIVALRPKGDKWAISHRSLLQTSLKCAPHRKTALDLFDRAQKQTDLCDLLIASAEEQARALNVLPPHRTRTSRMDVRGESWRRVLALVQSVGGTHYISGAGGARYIDHSAFDAAGVAVSYMEYNPVPWPQHGAAFTPYVTALDLIGARGDAAHTHLRPGLTPWRERLAKMENSDVPTD